VTLQSRSNQNPGIMSRTLSRCTYDKHLDNSAITCSSGVIELFVFLVLAPWWPSQDPDRTTKIWSVNLYDMGAHKVQVNNITGCKMCHANGQKYDKLSMCVFLG
jgi:hypothetical protein